MEIKMQERKLKSNFIKTNDIETAEKLRKAGFYEVSDTTPGNFVFVNCIFNFSKTDIDTKKVHFTDVLCL